jgi:hypothetical protein
MSDANNCIFILISQNIVHAYKKIAGANTSLVSVNPSPSINDNSAHTFQVVVGATTFDVSFDGVTCITAQSIDGALTGNLFAIGVYDTFGSTSDVNFNSVTIVA